MAKRKAKAAAAEGRLLVAINGHRLSGRKAGGAWRFECPDWPELAAKYDGRSDTADIIDEFVGRCLAPVREAVRRARQ